jgi:endonuclease YncB( thermonuclease family)
VPVAAIDEVAEVGAEGEFAEIATVTERAVPTETAAATITPASTSTRAPTRTATVAATSTERPAATEAPPAGAVVVAVPEGEEALVSRIIDGDTIDVLMNGQTYRVRYIGMDTPERGMPFFSEATEANRRLVEGQTVILVKDVSETDRYGRLLRYVYLTSGVFVNAELVRLGFAQIATYPPDVAHQEELLTLQQEAREAGRGLWAEAAVVDSARGESDVSESPAETEEPVLLASETPPAPATPSVVISYIYYNGQVPHVESDEYAEIANMGVSAVNLAGWRINAGAPGQDFVFPAFDLQPQQRCRIYTDESHAEHCGFSFGSGQALWRNSGDCGHLFDASRVEVSKKCYGDRAN